MAYDELQLIVGLLMTCCQITALSPDHYVVLVNAAVLQGNRLELRCRPNSSSSVHSWKFQQVGAADDVVIYSSGVGANNDTSTSFSFRKLLDGSVDLIINSTRLIDAGLYTCMFRVNVSEEGATVIIRQIAQLIVLETEPTCKATSEINGNEEAEMQCTVSYRGSLAPVMQWRQNDEAIIRDEVENVTVSNFTVTSTLRLLGTTGDNYTCMIYFRENITSDHDATKTIINTCTWKPDPHKSSMTTTTALSTLNNSYALIATVIFAAGFSAVAVILLMKTKVYRKNKNSVQSDEPLNESDYFQGVCQYEEIVDCEVTVTVKSSQSLQTEQDFGKTHNLNDERPFATTTNLTRVQINGKTRFLGEDGTEYLDLNGLKEQKQSTSCDVKPLNSSTIYEEVDHNTSVSALQL